MIFDRKYKRRLNFLWGIVVFLVIISMLLLYAPGFLSLLGVE